MFLIFKFENDVFLKIPNKKLKNDYFAGSVK